MLVRIDVYPDAGENISTTLHASLATTRSREGDDDKGCIMNVGRKSGDVTFQSDKSVSRQHCKLRLIVAPKENIGSGEDDLANLLVAPRNEEEMKACQDSPVGMCLVLENAGKGGTFVSVPKEKAPAVQNDDASATDDGGGNSEEDEETDDEGISQQSRSQKSNRTGSQQEEIPDFSEVNRQFWLGRKKQPYRDVELISVAVGESHILQFPAAGSRARSKAERTIMIQCGRFHSTIAITLIEYRLTFSRLTKPQRDTFQRRLPLLMGAQLVPDHVPDTRTTHLVTTQLVGGAKQLIAWSFRIPIVKPDFCQAIIDRTSPTDPFPLVEDFDCLNHEENQGNFWTKVKPNPELLASYTLLSVESNEMERLAEAAGIQMLRLYDFDSDDDAIQEAEDLVAQGTICMSISSRKALSKQLASRLGDKIFIITAKQLAKSVSEQNPTLLVGDMKDAANRESASNPTITAVKDSDEIVHEEESPSDFMTSAGAFQSQALLDLPRASRQRPLMDIAEEAEEDEIEEKSRGNETPKGGNDQEVANKPASPFKKLGPPPANSNTTTSKGNANAARAESLGGADSDGWFGTAPKNEKKRKEWRKRALKAVSEERGGFAMPPPAETDVMPIYPYSASEEQQQTAKKTSYYYNANSSSTSVSFALQASGPVRNFKKFRKNYVPPKPSLPVRITLRSVLPHYDKADEQQRVLDLEREELEEQQRLADELFYGDGMATMKKRRRRS